MQKAKAESKSKENAKPKLVKFCEAKTALHNAIQQEEPQVNEECVKENIEVAQKARYVSNDQMVYFFNGNDCRKLQNADRKRVRELQDANDSIQRQIAQIDHDVKHSKDGLTLLAEKERLLIMIARNTGEILKIHVENDRRIARIAEIERENIMLKEAIIDQRIKFIDTRNLHGRCKCAADFFLTESKIGKNSTELVDLTLE